MHDAPRYPIGAVSKLTGVPVETLRAWERRYRLVEPGRDARGRMYSEADVRKLKLLRRLVDQGHAIGRLAPMTEEDLRALEAQPADPVPRAPRPVDGAPALDELTAALERFDGPGAERELRRLSALLPPRALVHDVVLPLLRRIGEEWYRGRLAPAQEHLASAALRSLLGSLVRVHAPEEPRTVVVFATPPGERHELGLLAAAMLAVGGGLGAVYLGVELPAGEIALAARKSGARAVVLAAMGADGTTAAAEAAVGELAATLPRGVELWVGGAALPAVQAALRAGAGLFLADFDLYEEELRRLGARF